MARFEKTVTYPTTVMVAKEVIDQPNVNLESLKTHVEPRNSFPLLEIRICSVLPPLSAGCSCFVGTRELPCSLLPAFFPPVAPVSTAGELWKSRELASVWPIFGKCSYDSRQGTVHGPILILRCFDYVPDRPVSLVHELSARFYASEVTCFVSDMVMLFCCLLVGVINASTCRHVTDRTGSETEDGETTGSDELES
ncbi:hypothetical protein SLEP1_g39483 [Rubroshorea leprosula]|uniref:Uncharacterized protein n=1 Tax=Rubroshorea leprosula TaxID=152421 RepID=A0AAV5L0U7_9ROSI|nr:hypothetical protein SLEP1_g39483 [Rubroshorea leprosula]